MRGLEERQPDRMAGVTRPDRLCRGQRECERLGLQRPSLEEVPQHGTQEIPAASGSPKTAAGALSGVAAAKRPAVRDACWAKLAVAVHHRGASDGATIHPLPGSPRRWTAIRGAVEAGWERAQRGAAERLSSPRACRHGPPGALPAES